jgi:oligoribonuclease
MSDKETNLIWIDLEMTGLVPETDTIIEIATIVTDKDLNILAEGRARCADSPSRIIFASGFQRAANSFSVVTSIWR